MKLYLFGGAELELGQGEILKQMIKQVIVETNPKSVLHVPFARLHPTEEMFREGWFKDLMRDTDIQVLDARDKKDLARAEGALVFINGGHGKDDLLEGVMENEGLKELILKAEFIVGESSGSMIVAEWMRADDVGQKHARGLGILKNTIIEAHFTQRKRHKLLLDEMSKLRVKRGLGIDSVTGAVVDPAVFPEGVEIIGLGKVMVKSML